MKCSSLVYDVISYEHDDIVNSYILWKSMIENSRWNHQNKKVSFGILIFKESNTDQLLSSKMETIISNPGLHHLAEIVFWNLDGEDLRIFAQINQSCKQILQHPIFCLRKFKSLSKTNRDNWIKVIQSVKNSNEGIAILSYLRWNLKKEVLVDLPCYSSPAVQDNFRRKIWEICYKLNKSTKREIYI